MEELRILNNMMDNLDSLETISSDKQMSTLTLNDLNELGFIFVKKAEDYMKHHFCICMTVTRLEDDRVYPIVVIDDAFKNVDKNAQMFMVAHEIGHYCKQLHSILFDDNYNRIIEDEFEADEFAMDIIGKKESIKAIDSYIEFIAGLNADEDIKYLAITELEVRKINLILK